MNSKNKPPSEKIICRCNNVTQGEIEAAILSGCKTMNEVFDRTQAGVGACGGSCRKIWGEWLKYYLKFGKLPNHKD